MYRVAVHNGDRSETSPGMALLDRTYRKAIQNMIWSIGCEVDCRERRGPEGQIQNKCKLVINDESRNARTMWNDSERWQQSFDKIDAAEGPK